jgi:hypothetical protein
MKLLNRLRDQPGIAPAGGAPCPSPASLVYSRDEFLDPSDPAEFEPVLSGGQSKPVRTIRAGVASER